MNAVFRSKIDGRFGWVALAMPAVSLVALFTARPRSGLLWIPVAMLFLATGLVCWIFFATYYELRGGELVAHSGPFAWRIPLDEIADVRESRSVRSGPALSMDRLEVVCRGGRVLIISPADKAGFLAALRRLAPGGDGCRTGTESRG